MTDHAHIRHRDGAAGSDLSRTITDHHSRLLRLRDNVAGVLLGKPEAVQLALVTLLAEGHLLIEDVPGIGKTLLAKALARSLGCTFHRIQFTPDLLPGDLLGTSVYNQASSSFVFQPGPIFTQVVLADEINRATPRTQSALLEAMADRQVSMDGKTHVAGAAVHRPGDAEPLRVRGHLPAAREPARPLPHAPAASATPTARPSGSSSRATATASRSITSSRRCRARRSSPSSRRRGWSASRTASASTCSTSSRPPGSTTTCNSARRTRAALALYRAVQALALTEGRAYAVPDDVKRLARHVLAHRLLVRRGRAAQGSAVGPAQYAGAAGQIVDEIVRQTPVPA